jgi:hypothetical protein
VGLGLVAVAVIMVSQARFATPSAPPIRAARAARTGLAARDVTPW